MKRRAATGIAIVIALATVCARAEAAGMLSSESSKQPVVLVHGYFGSIAGQTSVELYWSFISTRLKLDGFDVYKIALPDGAMEDIPRSAAVLRDYIDATLARTGKSKVDLVTHSEGGLISRYYIKHLGGAGKVDDLVTIATPHRGTSVAHIGPGEAARQMEIYSSFLRELNTPPTLTGDIDYTAIFSNHDEMVVPNENGFFAGAVNMNVNLLGHGGIMFNEDVYKMTRGALQNNTGEGRRAIPIQIVKSAMVTNNPNVTLRLKKFNHFHDDEDMRQMRISNKQFLHGADWHSFADTKQWTLDDSRDGMKAVYVQFRHSGNFLFPKESPTYVDYIFLDREAPKASITALPDVTLESSATIGIDASDNTDDYKKFKVWNALFAYGMEEFGVKEMMVSADPSFAGASWQPFAKSAVVNLGAGSGMKTVYVKTRDAAGNVSAVATGNIRVIDVNAPDIGMVSEAARQPVVLVHGHSGSILGDLSVAVYWSYIGGRLKSEGFDVTEITLGNAAMQDIKKSARELRDFVAATVARTGSPKVDLVVHSEGGLVSRYYIRELGGAQFVDDLVTISTPHRGTTVAHAGMGLLGEGTSQMEVASPFIQELNSGDTLFGGVEYTAMFSHADEIVLPGTNGFFDGAVNVNFMLLGHGGILFAPEPYKVLRSAISYKYLFSKGQRPVEIVEPGMSTNKNTVEVRLKPCNHFSPQAPVTEMMVATNGMFHGAVSWQPFSNSVNLDISGKDGGLLGVHVKFRGADGVESPSYADYIIIDRETPTGTVSISATDAEKSTMTLKISAADNAEKYGYFKVTNLLEAYGILGIGARDMQVSTVSGFAGASWEPLAGSKTVTVSAGTGEKTAYVRFRDAAGNVSQTRSVSTQMFSPVNGFVAAEKGRAPVVFVHGYGAVASELTSKINWLYYTERLKKEGYSTHVIALDAAGTGDVIASAAKLRDFVQGVLRETGAEKVDIVAHSEGGLVARYYIKELGGVASVDDLVTISTPHRGTVIAAVGPGEAARQMTVSSDFLASLNSGDSVPGMVDYTAIFSTDDGVVVPAENAFYDGAINVVRTGLTHATILLDDGVYQVVKSALSVDTGRGDSELPVRIIKSGMASSSPYVLLSLNYYNHNAPLLPAGEMMISGDPSFRGAAWQPFSNSANWTIDGGDGLKAVYVKFRAAQGGVESPAYADYIVIDRTAPSGSAVLLPVSGSDGDVELAIAAADNSDVFSRFNIARPDVSYGIPGLGVTGMMVSDSPDFAGAAWESFSSRKTRTLPAGGAGKVYVKLHDSVGNVSETIVASKADATAVAEAASHAADAARETAQEIADEVDAVITAAESEIDLSLVKGWNLIYLPEELPEEFKRGLSELIDSGATMFDISDRDFRSSLQAMNARGGRAVWVEVRTPAAKRFVAKASSSARTVMLDRGWNIIGVSGAASADPSAVTITFGGETISLADAAARGIVAKSILEFDGSEYKPAARLLPLRAYLLRAYDGCLLNLP